jgi:hypothetical protein
MKGRKLQLTYGELDIRNYTFRTIGNSEEDVLATLKKFWLKRRKPWGLTLKWDEVAEGGYIRMYPLELNKITEE